MNVKKFIFSLVLASLFLLISSVLTFAQNATVNAVTLNIRSLPSTSSDIVTRASKGASLDVFSKTDNWYFVKTPDGFTGYASADFVTLSTAYFGRVNASTLLVHSSTGVNSPVIAKLKNSTAIELLSFDGSWYKIRSVDGTEGFVSASYITPDPSIKVLNGSELGAEAVTASQTGQAYPSGYISCSLTRLHETTGEYATVTALMTKGEKVELLIYDGAWYKIRRQDGTEGYVSVGFVALSEADALSATDYPIPGFVDATRLNFRSSPSTASLITASLSQGAEILLYSKENSWYKAKLFDGKEGYVSEEYISLNPVEYSVSSPPIINTTYAPKVPPTEQTYALGQKIVDTAHLYLSKPYRYATEGPDTFDCSGFTMYVFSQHSIKLPRPSRDQFYCGFPVEKSELIPGDLVFFSSKNTSGVAHVGIYIGNGNFIHASSGSAYAVTVTALSKDYYVKHYLGARRVI